MHTQHSFRVPHGLPVARRAAQRYLLSLATLSLAAYAFPFVAERVAPLDRFSVSHWGQILDYSYGRDGEDADVVIFGDSTAIYGVDTAQLSRQLGLKAINLPATIGSLPIMGDRTLRNYLAHNRPPQLIVFYFAPWHLDFLTSDNAFQYEGIEQVLRHGSAVEAIQMAWRRPMQIASFPLRFYAAPSRLTHFYRAEEYIPVEVIGGHTPYRHKQPLGAGCVFPPFLPPQPKTASTQALVRDFTTPHTRTLVYLSPLPDCEGATEILAHRYAGIDTEPPVVLPRENFAYDGLFLHVRAESTVVSTDLLERAIRESLGR